LKVSRKILFEFGILLFSLFYLLSSAKLEMGELSRPGPGFFPTVLGAAGVVIASFLVAGTYLRQKKEREKEVPPGGIESPSAEKDAKEARQGFTRIVAFILALTALVGLYEILGSLVCFFVVTVIFGHSSRAPASTTILTVRDFPSFWRKRRNSTGLF
jgi:hypothetical protein